MNALVKSVVFAFYLLVLPSYEQSCSAFVPAQPKRSAPVTTVNTAFLSKSCTNPRTMIRMSEEGEDNAEAEEPAAKAPPTSGTFYDDEVDPIPSSKQGISDSMRERLIREASQGLDSDRKQTNVLLYIIAGVALLVILGGAGIFY